MLAKTNFITNAHRIDREIADNVTEVQPGQLFQFDAEGKLTYADGTKRAYPTLNSRYAGAGYGAQTEKLEGRDDVSMTNRIAVMIGGFEIGTDQYDTAVTYEYGAPLVAGANGKVTVAETGAEATDPNLIRGYVTHVPADDSDFLRYEG